MNLTRFRRTAFAVAVAAAALPLAAFGQGGGISNPRPLTAPAITGALGYTPARSGSNSDITALTSLTTPITGAQGGTGVANTGKTITLGGSLTTSGAYSAAFILSGTTIVSFPTSGTLLTTTGDGSGLTALNGSAITSGLNASAITSGIVPIARGGTGTGSSTGTGPLVLAASPTLSGIVGLNGTGQTSGLSIGADQASPVAMYLRAANNVAVRGASTSTTFSVMSDENGTNQRRLDFSANATAASIFSNWTAGSIPFNFGAGAPQWQVNTSGHLVAMTDNSYDVGANGASRPRNIYVANNVVANATSVASRVEGVGATRIGLSSDGVATFTNQAVTAGFLLDVTTDAVAKFRNRANSADITLTALTQSPGDSSSKVATTNFVNNAVSAAGAVPTGTIMPFAGFNEPGGYLFANGQAVSRTTYVALFNTLTSSATVTITIASPGVVTWTAHGFIPGMPIVLTSTGALPTGLTAGTVYYVASATTNTFQLAATLNGSSINTTGSQSGTHTGRAFPFGVGDGSTTFNVPDLRGRAPFGVDNMGGVSAAGRLGANTSVGGITYNAILGTAGGAQTHVQTLGELAAHQHTSNSFWNVSGTDTGGRLDSGGILNVIINNQGSTTSAGSSAPFNITPPALVMNYIIRQRRRPTNDNAPRPVGRRRRSVLRCAA